MKFAKFIKKHWKAAAAIFAIAIATTVGVVVVRAATVTLSVDRPVINFNSDSEVVTVNATVSIINATTTTGAFTWAMADPNIAVVSNNEGVGTVTARAAGKTNLTVGYLLDDVHETKTIPVTVPLVVYHDAVSMIMQPGNEGAVSCNAASTRNVVWSSANSNIATVTPTGNKDASVKAISGGTTQITASIPEDGLSFSFNVTVGVTVDEDSIEVEQGATKVLTTNSNSVADVFWWSDNENVATVVNGVVTGVYAGSTTIYASCIEGDAGNNAGDRVTVTVPYKITPPATTVLVGDSITIPNTANPSEVNYSSSNNNIISYDSKTGMFTAHATGTADLTVTWNGNVETVTITVIDGLTLSNTSTALNIGASDTIKAILSNTDEPVSWKVADPSMVELSVSEDGLSATVTALATGATESTTLIATQVINGIVKTATCEIYVLNPVKSLTLLYNGNEIKDTISIQRGTGIYITAFLNFGDSVVPDNTKLSWISSDPSILTVEPVTGEGQQQLCLVSGVTGGNATITVVSEDGLYIATADFYVTEGVTSIELDNTSVTAQMALQKFQLTATVLPAMEGVDTSVTWASLDPSVLTVDQNGLVTFVGPGETYVSATSNADTTKDRKSVV